MTDSPSFLDWNEFYRFVVFGGALTSACIFVFGQINSIKAVIYKNVDKVLDKLEYHERHDDERFEAVRKDLWQIRVANAASTGKTNGSSLHN